MADDPKPPSDPAHEASSSASERQPDTSIDENESSVVVLPPEALREAAQSGRSLQVTITTAYSGPLPPPSTLRGYDQVHPGLSKIIVEQFQAEGAHRRKLQLRGQQFAFSIALVSILFGVGLGAWLQSWAAALAVIGPVCGTLGTAQLLEYWFKMK